MTTNFNGIKNSEITDRIKQVLCSAVNYLSVKQNVSVNISFVGKQTIKKLNAEYRQKNMITDVLSFPLFEKNELGCGEMKNEQIMSDLGDIAICTSVAKQQAAAYNHSLAREMCFLALHGFLHLLGYDHINSNDEKEMFDIQEKVLKINKIGR